MSENKGLHIPWLINLLFIRFSTFLSHKMVREKTAFLQWRGRNCQIFFLSLFLPDTDIPADQHRCDSKSFLQQDNHNIT